MPAGPTSSILDNSGALVIAVLVVNALVVLLMFYDKRAAMQQGWRVPEANLLLLCLLGGTPAMLYSMKHFRHKSAKMAFKIKVYIVLVLQLLGLMVLPILT